MIFDGVAKFEQGGLMFFGGVVEFVLKAVFKRAIGEVPVLFVHRDVPWRLS